MLRVCRTVVLLSIATGSVMSLAERSHFRQAILLGLSAVPKCGIPGSVIPFGIGKAFCVLPTPTSSCPVAAAEYGNGRIVAYGHNGYFGVQATADDKGERIVKLIRNSLLWSAASPHRSLQGCDNSTCNVNDRKLLDSSTTIKLGGLGFDQSWLNNIASALSSNEAQFVAGQVATDITRENIQKAISQNPSAILWTQRNGQLEIPDSKNNQIDPRVTDILNYVRGGGALLVAITPWGWEQLADRHGGNIASNCIFNSVLQRAGLSYVGDYADGDKNGEFEILPLSEEAQYNDAEFAEFSTDLIAQKKALTNAQLYRASQSLTSLPDAAYGLSFPALPDGLPCQLVAVRSVMDKAQRILSPYASLLQFPLKLGAETAVEKQAAGLYVPLFARSWYSRPPQQCGKAPSLGKTPSDVASHTMRLPEAVWTLNPWLEGWQSTGFYAPAGEVVIISLSTAAVNAYPGLKVRVQVGSHTDGLGLMKNTDRNHAISRWPNVVTGRMWTPKAGVTTTDTTIAFHDTSLPETSHTMNVASPYGGLLYFELRGGVDTKKAAVPITFMIRNAVMAPYWNVQKETGEVPVSPFTDTYPHRQMSLKDRATQFGAPYGEIEGRYIVLTVPRETLAAVDDPMGVAAFWDSVLCHELALSGQELKRKERVVTDVQISAGYMHSGYPIMTFLDVATPSGNNPLAHIVDTQTLKKEGSWGLYHEMGHNRQCGEWTFWGTGEVTVNIFSMYCYHMMNGYAPSDAPWVRDNVLKQAMSYIKDKKPFKEVWCGQPGIALGTYMVFIEQFGWQAIADIFREYKGLPDNKKPSNDQDKIQQWILRTSKRVGLDLRPYYEQWRWPVDKSQTKDLDALPKYESNVMQVLDQMLSRK